VPSTIQTSKIIVEELTRMKAGTSLKDASSIPLKQFVAKKIFRLSLCDGQFGETVSSSKAMVDRRRDHLVRVSFSLRQTARRETGEVCVLVNIHGTVHHYALVITEENPVTFAYIECIKSSADLRRASGLAERRCENVCSSSLRGTM